jgi:hypothetical protein
MRQGRAASTAKTKRTAPDPAAGRRARRTARAAYTALGWVVLFFAFQCAVRRCYFRMEVRDRHRLAVAAAG